MILAKVLGPVVSTVKHASYAGLKLLVVQPVNETGAAEGKSLLAVDRVSSAGEGDTVLILKEGTGVRQLFGLPKEAKLPIQACIVGVVDEVAVGAGEKK
ncbi:MAG: EutN/CcmL family microcompartment protein [Deltaproteobacteria bacterium]|nr:EutN/CcmL family microcompartment protein [Deltaproteobacteria bacterium]